MNWLNTTTKKLAVLTAATLFLIGCEQGPAPSREAIVAQFPSVDQGTTRPENPRVLCPFVRMLERSGLFDEEVQNQPTLTVSVNQLTSAAKTFGCGFLECNTVARSVSSGQGNGGDAVNIGSLHTATGIAHECGFTFEFGGTEVSDEVRANTLARLAELADADGHLVYQDLLTTKLEICASQGVEKTAAGDLETRLIFAYLGGVDRGFISHADVTRFLHAEMPLVKTSKWINASLLNGISAD